MRNIASTVSERGSIKPDCPALLRLRLLLSPSSLAKLIRIGTAEEIFNMLSTVVSLLAAASLASAGIAKEPCKPSKPVKTTTAWESAYTATGTAAVAAAAATAKTSSPTSHVKGKAFDRFVVVYFENQDYDKSDGDRKPNTAT